jgi:hypothetical protein
MLMLHLVHALPLMGIVPTLRFLLKAFVLMSLSLILIGGLLLVPAHLPVAIPTLTSMITAVAQVTHENKKKRRKGNVNLWFESNNTLLIYTHICLLLLPQACTLGCCNCHIATL